MKKTLAVLAVVAVLGVGTVAFAHGFGPGGFGYGHMGYGNHMGYGPGMMGYGPGFGYGQGDAKFLEETADLRREINAKRFEYAEALRSGDEKKAETLAGELEELTGKLSAQTPQGRTFARGGYGYCW